MDTQLAIDTLQKALERNPSEKTILLHSVQGSQYTSKAPFFLLTAGVTADDIRRMSEDDLLDMDYFLNEDDLLDDEAGVEDFIIF